MSFLIKLFKRNLVNKDEEERFYIMCPTDSRAHALVTEMDDDDETRSIESFSTTATIDNNPGAGRALDTYFYQPVGRRIERLAMKITIRYLHPWRISAFLVGLFGGHISLRPKHSLNAALNGIDGYRNGPIAVAGLKSLVRQAQ